jgi:hypothetical protein
MLPLENWHGKSLERKRRTGIQSTATLGKSNP